MDPMKPFDPAGCGGTNDNFPELVVRPETWLVDIQKA